MTLRLGQVTEEFRRAWCSGEQPRIEDFLVQSPAPCRRDLLLELLIEEIKLRHSNYDPASPADYESRFPGDLETVRAAFEQFPRRQAEGLSPGLTKGRAECIGSDSGSNRGSVPGIDSRFQLRGELGRGANGYVLRALDTKLQREVAIKVALASRFRSPDDRSRFVDEARRIARLEGHPGIVKVFDVNDDGEFPWIVEEYIDGKDLAQRLLSESWPLDRCLKVMVQVAETMRFAHSRGIYHCDLKPANILIDSEDRPHVVDFGLSTDPVHQRSLRGLVIGTPAYMSPEQTRGETHFLDGRADIWSLGVILYELTTRTRPFQGESREELYEEIQHREPRPPSQIDPTVPADLEQIILRCLRKEIGQRYNSAFELAKALRRTEGTEPSRHRLILAAPLAALVATIAWGAWPGPRDQRPDSPTTPVSSSDVTAAPAELGSLLSQFRIEHLSWDPEQDLVASSGAVGIDSFESAERDYVQIAAQFTQPLYCYLLAFNPDGTTQVCWPWDSDGNGSSDVPPPQVRELKFPGESVDGFRLTDGSGQQAFAVVASRDRLPPFNEWNGGATRLPWKHVESGSVQRFDHARIWISLGRDRGQVESLPATAVFQTLCRYLKEQEGVDVLAVTAFPVRSRRLE